MVQIRGLDTKNLLPSEGWGWQRGAQKEIRYFIAEQPAPTPHLAHPGGCAALRLVPVNVPCVSRSYEHFPDKFDLHLLHIFCHSEGWRWQRGVHNLQVGGGSAVHVSKRRGPRPVRFLSRTRISWPLAWMCLTLAHLCLTLVWMCPALAHLCLALAHLCRTLIWVCRTMA